MIEEPLEPLLRPLCCAILLRGARSVEGLPRRKNARPKDDGDGLDGQAVGRMEWKLEEEGDQIDEE